MQCSDSITQQPQKIAIKLFLQRIEPFLKKKSANDYLKINLYF